MTEQTRVCYYDENGVCWGTLEHDDGRDPLIQAQESATIRNRICIEAWRERFVPLDNMPDPRGIFGDWIRQ